MWLSQLNRGASLLAALSLLGSLAAGEVFDKLHALPDGWKEERSADASQQILLQVALKQHDASGFEQALLDMSTPGHQDYGKHFKSYDEVKNLLQPTDATVRSVRDWLESAGISDIEQDADWFSFATTVGVANSLLNTEFKWYKNDELETSQLRTLQYSVPGSVADHLNMVQPTTRFTQMHPTSAKVVDANEHIREAVESGSEIPCDKAITPSCLASLYNTDFYHADRHAPSSIGFCSYLGQSARWDDLELFEENIAQYAKGQNFSVVTYNGATNDQSSNAGSGEANLDAQYIVGVGYPLPVTEYITAGRGPVVPDLSYSGKNTNEPYLTFLQNILKRDQGDLPQVLSTSYGEDEQTLPESYARSVCNLYAQLGSRGVSVIFASGDAGVGSACQRNDGTERETFNPQFPAACPWVTSVGGTTNSTPEAATFFSSGGFSHYWSRPKYQDEAVSSYLDKLGDQWKGLYNPNGRGFPDVSAQSVKYAVYDKGELKLYQGTSCAAPTFSGVIGLLNNARMRFRQPPMGFLNPFLYGYGKYGLKDITHGGSTGCNGHDRFHGPPNGSPVIPYASWNATEGWDPVSGLGTPLFHRLKALSFFS